jgi:hypothetical protein
MVLQPCEVSSTTTRQRRHDRTTLFPSDGGVLHRFLAIVICLIMMVLSPSSWLTCCGSPAYLEDAPATLAGAVDDGDDDGVVEAEASCPNLRNSAFVFVKPSANTELTRALVRERLQTANCNILSERSIDGGMIDKMQLIDRHYYAIAQKATLLAPHELPVPVDLFQHYFHESWETVLQEDRTCNALDACHRLGCTAAELDEAWQRATVVKLGGGFYCGLVTINGTSLYLFNAFFLQMRSKFVQEQAKVHCFDIEWDGAVLSWQDFRGKVIGSTDPAEAPPGSLRRIIFDTYEDLGLTDEPNKSDNGVHASASPLEGLGEKMNWLQRPINEDSFGKALLAEGIPAGLIRQWTLDPQVNLAADRSARGSIFDALEDLDAPACLAKLKVLYNLV